MTKDDGPEWDPMKGNQNRFKNLTTFDPWTSKVNNKRNSKLKWQGCFLYLELYSFN